MTNTIFHCFSLCIVSLLFEMGLCRLPFPVITRLDKVSLTTGSIIFGEWKKGVGAGLKVSDGKKPQLIMDEGFEVKEVGKITSFGCDKKFIGHSFHLDNEFSLSISLLTLVGQSGDKYVTLEAEVEQREEWITFGISNMYNDKIKNLLIADIFLGTRKQSYPDCRLVSDDKSIELFGYLDGLIVHLMGEYAIDYTAKANSVKFWNVHQLLLPDENKETEVVLVAVGQFTTCTPVQIAKIKEFSIIVQVTLKNY